MKSIHYSRISKTLLADIITPVSIYLKMRDLYPGAILLESSDYHHKQDSFSFICMESLASFEVDRGLATLRNLDDEEDIVEVTRERPVDVIFDEFISGFKRDRDDSGDAVDGLFGYTTYGAVQYFEDLQFKKTTPAREKIPEIRYAFYRFIIAINHFQNTLTLIENVPRGEESGLQDVQDQLTNRNYATYPFYPVQKEDSNLNDQAYMNMVKKGISHCHRGDVFQIVLSRGFSQGFRGDEFNVYRSLRSINPSPYLFFFDYGSYRIFGSSPEAQLQIRNSRAFIHPIAGTFKRTGDDLEDKELALALAKDEKENSEHVMLVDLARNDLSRNANDVRVETFKEIQYYSHVLHMVSVVSGQLPEGFNALKILADTFPAGTLSGAPKYRAMQLIDEYENKGRGYYGGCIGFLGFNGDLNHAIVIRSFLSKNNTLFYQAGAGIVADSKPESELREVNNKLEALKSAINQAKDI